jgi:regulatory protein
MSRSRSGGAGGPGVTDPMPLPEGVVRGARTPPGNAPVPPRTREGPVAVVGADVDEEVRKALAFILRSTGASPQTENELRAKLRTREVSDDTIEEAIATARSMRALDDEAFAISWVAERGLGRGYGRARLRRELAKRQIPDHLAEQALEQLEERDDVSAAADLARARLRQLPASLATEAVARRLTAYLVRRGHPPGLAQRVAMDVSGLNREWG